MPYINKEKREIFDPEINMLIKKLHEDEWDPGAVNYVFSRVVNHLFKMYPSYSTINDIVGVLENVKAEFVRRKAVPYEEEKIKINGDI